MIDSNAAFVAWISQSTALTGLLGAAMGIQPGPPAIYCGMLPEGYKPEVNGRAITFATRGGPGADPEVPIISPSIQVECWAPALCSQQAREVYRALFDQIAGKCNINLGANGYILSCIEEVHGQDLTDPDTQWTSVLAYYRLTLRN
jgi:hypothetical protein